MDTREVEIRKNLNNYWERKLADGVTECYSKDYYNADGTRITESLGENLGDIILKIERELNSV
jgi:hypothetical protein